MKKECAWCSEGKAHKHDRVRQGVLLPSEIEKYRVKFSGDGDAQRDRNGSRRYRVQEVVLVSRGVLGASTRERGSYS